MAMDMLRQDPYLPLSLSLPSPIPKPGEALRTSPARSVVLCAQFKIVLYIYIYILYIFSNVPQLLKCTPKCTLKCTPITVFKFCPTVYPHNYPILPQISHIFYTKQQKSVKLSNFSPLFAMYPNQQSIFQSNLNQLGYILIGVHILQCILI